MTIKKTLAAIAVLAGTALAANAQNPYLPLWEHIPDGEPYIFEDPDQPGQYRVYIYGSHDSLIDKYCGKEQVVWSCPVNDLKNWRYDGVIFESIRDAKGELLNRDETGDILYAPDIVERVENGKKTYYLYPNNQGRGRNTQVAKSNRPDGPFEVINWSASDPRRTEGILGFDPGVLIDDDGKVYGYWGFEQSFGGELDPVNMSNLRSGAPMVTNMVSDYKHDGVFRFFEASSIRKIKDKYVFVYSRKSAEGEWGLPVSNYTLAYAYSDYPLGPWTYGGTLIDCRGRDTDPDGNVIITAEPFGNTHGSILEINGQWYVFYHRQTGEKEYSRQAMVSPIDVNVEEGLGGKVTISEAEYTSEGFELNGLDPYKKLAAGTACVYMGPKEPAQEYPTSYHTGGSHPGATYAEVPPFENPYEGNDNYTPIVMNNNGSIVGWKYFNMDGVDASKAHKLILRAETLGNAGNIKIMIDSPWEAKGGVHVGDIKVSKKASGKIVELKSGALKLPKLSGKHALYFVFTSPVDDKPICDMYSIQLVK